MMAAQTVFVHLISRVPSLGSPAVFSAFLHETRWAGLEGEGGEAGECFAGEEREEAERVADGWERDGSELGAKLSEGAAEVAKIVNDELVSNGLRMNFVGDYIEELSRWAVGQERTGRFIRDCLAYDNVEVAEMWDEQTGIMEGLAGDPNRNPDGDEL